MFVIAVALLLAEALAEPAAAAEVLLWALVELLELLHAEMRIAAAAAPTASIRDSDANFMGLLMVRYGQIALPPSAMSAVRWPHCYLREDFKYGLR
jgi:hypothetical protein